MAFYRVQQAASRRIDDNNAYTRAVRIRCERQLQSIDSME
jgi:hypothetical protein